jgi:hypothetical protein
VTLIDLFDAFDTSFSDFGFHREAEAEECVPKPGFVVPMCGNVTRGYRLVANDSCIITDSIKDQFFPFEKRCSKEQIILEYDEHK